MSNIFRTFVTYDCWGALARPLSSLHFDISHDISHWQLQPCCELTWHVRSSWPSLLIHWFWITSTRCSLWEHTWVLELGLLLLCWLRRCLILCRWQCGHFYSKELTDCDGCWCWYFMVVSSMNDQLLNPRGQHHSQLLAIIASSTDVTSALNVHFVEISVLSAHMTSQTV